MQNKTGVILRTEKTSDLLICVWEAGCLYLSLFGEQLIITGTHTGISPYLELTCNGPKTGNSR